MRDYRYRTHITTNAPWGAMPERTYRARDERLAEANAAAARDAPLGEPGSVEPIFPDPHTDPW
jgi:hypothetical protein